MSVSSFIQEKAPGLAALAVSFTLAGCATQMQNLPIIGGQMNSARTDPSDIASVHPRIKPQTCRTYEAAARRAPRNHANQGVGNMVGAGISAILGNTRGAVRAAQRGGEQMARGAGDNADNQYTLDSLKAACNRDIQALFAPGGQCATFTRQSSSVATQDNRVVGSSRGGIQQQQDCASASSYIGPNLMVTPQYEAAPQGVTPSIQGVPAPRAPAGGYPSRSGRIITPAPQ